MDAVAADAAADHDDAVAGTDLFEYRALGNEPQGAAEYQGIFLKVFVEIDGAIDRGYAHPVTVVPHSRNHAVENLPGGKVGAGFFVRPFVHGPETEDVGVGDRFGAQ